MHLYDYLPSGNGYKIRLFAGWIGQPLAFTSVDVPGGETRTPGFLAINPGGQVPALVLDDGRVLTESNAILHYLGDGTPYLPTGRFERADALRWMFFEQYRHEPAIAVARYIRAYAPDARAGELPALTARGEAVLRLMDDHLAACDWMAGGARSVADVCLYAYTHVADEAGFALADYPRIEAWLARVADHPGHVLITDAPRRD